MSATKKFTKHLDAREKRFVDEYLVDLDPERAAITAGYAKSTAHTKAYTWVSNGKTKPHVFKAIIEAQQERSERVRIGADYVLKRLLEIDQMDVADILNDDGSAKPLKEWPKIWRQFLSGLDIVEKKIGNDQEALMAAVKKIKWPDKLRNLELLGKHVDVQAFKDRVDVSVKNKTEELSNEELEKIAKG